MKPIQCPIIVVGPPRSGTSVTAKVLSEHLGVKMGNVFLNLGEKINQRSYEDMDVVDASTGYSKNQDAEVWKVSMSKFFDKMQQGNCPWGFKDPRVAFGMKWIIGHFNGRVSVIRCHRSEALVVKSMMEKLEMKRVVAKHLFDGTNKMLDECLAGVPTISLSFNGQIVDEEVLAETISDGLGKLAHAFG